MNRFVAIITTRVVTHYNTGSGSSLKARGIRSNEIDLREGAKLKSK